MLNNNDEQIMKEIEADNRKTVMVFYIGMGFVVMTLIIITIDLVIRLLKQR